MTINALQFPPQLPRLNRVELLKDLTTSSIEALAEDIQKRLTILAEDQDNLRMVLERFWLRPIASVANWMLLLVNVGVFYFQLPNPSTGEYADGDVRLIKTAQDTVALQVHDGTDWNITLARWRNDD